MFKKFIAWLASAFAPKPAPAPVATPLPVKPAENMTPPWIVRALSKLGEKELPGSSKNNSFIVSLFKWTTYDTSVDETAWCAAFASWALDIKGNAAAFWFASWDLALDVLQNSCVVVLQHADGELKGHYHVTFCFKVIRYVSDTDFEFESVGGNQGNAVTQAVYSSAHYKIVGKRWPKNYPVPGEPKPSSPMTSIILPWEAKDSSRAAWTDKVLAKIDEHFAIFDSAKDAADYHPNYSSLPIEQRKHVWANFVCAIAKFESGWDPKSRMTESTGQDSVGVLQLSPGEIKGDLENPLDNLDGGIDIMAKLIKRDGVIASGGYASDDLPKAKGAAAYWSVLRLAGSKTGKHHKAEIEAMSRAI